MRSMLVLTVSLALICLKQPVQANCLANAYHRNMVSVCLGQQSQNIAQYDITICEGGWQWVRQFTSSCGTTLSFSMTELYPPSSAIQIKSYSTTSGELVLTVTPSAHDYTGFTGYLWEGYFGFTTDTGYGQGQVPFILAANTQDFTICSQSTVQCGWTPPASCADAFDTAICSSMYSPASTCSVNQPTTLTSVYPISYSITTAQATYKFASDLFIPSAGCTILDYSFYDMTNSQITDYVLTEVGTDIIITNSVSHTGTVTVLLKLRVTLSDGAIHNVMVGTDDTLVFPKPTCNFMNPVDLNVSPSAFIITGAQQPTFLIGTSDFITSPTDINHGNGCAFTATGAYTTLDATGTLLSDFALSFTASQLVITYTGSTITAQTQQLYLKFEINGQFIHWATDSLGQQALTLTIQSAPIIALPLIAPTGPCFNQIYYPANLTKASIKYEVLDVDEAPWWILGKFTTDTGCQIDSFQIFDGQAKSQSSAMELGDWSVQLSDQVLKVKLPEGSQLTDMSYKFYLKVHVQAHSAWIDASKIQSSWHQYFQIDVVTKNTPPFFAGMLQKRINLTIANGLLEPDQFIIQFPKIEDFEKDQYFVDISLQTEYQRLIGTSYFIKNNSIEFKNKMSSGRLSEQKPLDLNITLQDIRGASNQYTIELTFIQKLQDEIKEQLDEFNLGQNTPEIQQSSQKLQNHFSSLNKKYIRMYANKMDQSGQLTVFFSEPLQTEGVNITHMNTSSLLLSIIQQKDEKPIDYSWEAVSLMGNELILQVYFEDVDEVSPELLQHRIQVEIEDNSLHLFRSAANDTTLDRNQKSVQVRVPPQMPIDQFKKIYQDATVILASFAEGLIIFALFLQIITIGKGAARHMKIFVRIFQLVIHLPLMSIRFPGNVMFMFEALMPVVAFDFLELFLDWRQQSVIQLDFERQKQVEHEILDQVKDIGYSSHLSIIPLNSLSFYVIFQMVAIVVLLILLVLKKLGISNNTSEALTDKLRAIFIFEQLIELVINEYFQFLIAGYLNFSFLHFEPFGDLLSSTVAIYALLMTIVIIPLLSVIIIVIDTEKLTQSCLSQKISIIYEEFCYKFRDCRAYFLLFVLRRIAFVVICQFNKPPEYPLIYQIILALAFNLGFTIYIGISKPMRLPIENKYELLNEFLVTVSTHQALLFTSFTSALPASTRFHLSWPLIILITFCCLFNLSIVLYRSVQTLFLIIKKYYKRAKQWYERIFGIKKDGKGNQLESSDESVDSSGTSDHNQSESASLDGDQEQACLDNILNQNQTHDQSHQQSSLQQSTQVQIQKQPKKQQQKAKINQKSKPTLKPSLKLPQKHINAIKTILKDKNTQIQESRKFMRDNMTKYKMFREYRDNEKNKKRNKQDNRLDIVNDCFKMNQYIEQTSQSESMPVSSKIYSSTKQQRKVSNDAPAKQTTKNAFSKSISRPQTQKKTINPSDSSKYSKISQIQIINQALINKQTNKSTIKQAVTSQKLPHNKKQQISIKEIGRASRGPSSGPRQQLPSKLLNNPKISSMKKPLKQAKLSKQKVGCGAFPKTSIQKSHLPNLNKQAMSVIHEENSEVMANQSFE